MKNTFVKICLVAALSCFFGQTVFAGEYVLDNDAAAGQPGTSGIGQGSWTYLKSGHFGDARMSSGANAFYRYSFKNAGNSNKKNFYAYLSNGSFNGVAGYVIYMPGTSTTVTKNINQDTAPAGFGYVYGIGGDGFRVDVWRSTKTVGADAIKVTW